jgi:hypothetical protein
MKAIKGFRPDMTCDPTGDKPFQFAEGGTYEEASAKVCSHGFHAVTMPLDVFGYYPPATSVYHEVEVDDDAKTHGDDSKVASKRITIGAKLSIAGLVKAQFQAVWDRCTLEPGSTSTGNRGAASSTGYQGAASSTGYRGAASSTGYQGAASSTGDRGAASSTGDRGAASSTGDRGAASSTGYQGAASSTGYRGAASSTGDRGAASSTGYRGAASSTGYRGAASSTGYQGAASSPGNRGAASSTGYQGAASSTGYQGAASSTGADSVAMASGWRGRAKGADGCALFLVERDDELHIVAAKAAIVGRRCGNRLIKADVWYGLIGGKVVEVDSDGEAIL